MRNIDIKFIIALIEFKGQCEFALAKCGIINGYNYCQKNICPVYPNTGICNGLKAYNKAQWIISTLKEEQIFEAIL